MNPFQVVLLFFLSGTAGRFMVLNHPDKHTYVVGAIVATILLMGQRR